MPTNPKLASLLTPQSIQAAMKIGGAAGKLGKNILINKGLIKAPIKKTPVKKSAPKPVVVKTAAPVKQPWYVEYKTPLIIGTVVLVGTGIAIAVSKRRN